MRQKNIEHDKEIRKEVYISLGKKSRKLSKISDINSVIMEYQEIINLADDTPNQPSKFRTKNLVQLNDDLCGTYNTNNQIKFKTSMLKSSFCDYSDVHVFFNGARPIPNATKTQILKQTQNNTGKKVILKNCAPFIHCISEIINTQVDIMLKTLM